MAEIPSIELLARLDTDGDGTLDDAEADAGRRTQCAERLPEIEVLVDSQPLALELWAAGLQQRPGAGAWPPSAWCARPARRIRQTVR